MDISNVYAATHEYYVFLFTYIVSEFFCFTFWQTCPIHSFPDSHLSIQICKLHYIQLSVSTYLFLAYGNKIEILLSRDLGLVESIHYSCRVVSPFSQSSWDFQYRQFSDLIYALFPSIFSNVLVIPINTLKNTQDNLYRHIFKDLLIFIRKADIQTEEIQKVLPSATLFHKWPQEPELS